MSPKVVEREGANLIQFPEDNVQWWAVVKMAVNIQVKGQEIASSSVSVPSYLSVIASLKQHIAVGKARKCDHYLSYIDVKKSKTMDESRSSLVVVSPFIY
jgi:hypothetical protein